MPRFARDDDAPELSLWLRVSVVKISASIYFTDSAIHFKYAGLPSSMGMLMHSGSS